MQYVGFKHSQEAIDMFLELFLDSCLRAKIWVVSVNFSLFCVNSRRLAYASYQSLRNYLARSH